MAILLLVLLASPSLLAVDREYHEYSGCCDGSAGTAVNAELFASASDEGNVLRLYRRDAGGAPVASLNVGAFLDARDRAEPDLEGAAKLGDLVFWIGSHGRKADRHPRPGREVLFATAIRGAGQDVRLVPVGQPFHGLISALRSAPSLAQFQLGRAAVQPAESVGGLNIEGIAAGPKSSLWIGFRNPVPLGRSLLVPLLNPREVIEGRAASLGSPVQLDLEGLGIRDIARAGDRYLILGGPAEGGGRHRLFLWSGDATSPVEIKHAVPKELQAEAIVVDDRPDTHETELLADDDSKKIGGRRCESLEDATRRVFRGLKVGF